jgi:hypothetical protein
MPAAIATPWGERGNGQERMIGQLTGTLLEKNPPEVLLDCHGVGYEVQVPMSTFYNLPALGQPVSLLTSSSCARTRSCSTALPRRPSARPSAS